MAQRKAYLILDTLDDALVAVEERARDSYGTTLIDELDDLSEQVKELASLCRATGAKDCHALQDSFREIRKRVLVLKKAREKTDPKCKHLTLEPLHHRALLHHLSQRLNFHSWHSQVLMVFWEGFNSIISKETGHQTKKQVYQTKKQVYQTLTDLLT